MYLKLQLLYIRKSFVIFCKSFYFELMHLSNGVPVLHYFMRTIILVIGWLVSYDRGYFLTVGITNKIEHLYCNSYLKFDKILKKTYEPFAEHTHLLKAFWVTLCTNTTVIVLYL